MTFTKRLREGIRRGRIRCSIRVWTRPHVRVGGRYPMDEGHIVVDSISPITLDDVTQNLARESGFESVEDLLQIARHGRGENVEYGVAMRASGTYSVTVAFLFMVSAMGVLPRAASPGQDVSAPLDEVEALWNRQSECLGAPVRDMPFSAEAITTWQPPASSGKAQMREVARYYRDRAGRVRIETTVGLTPQRVMIALEPDAPSTAVRGYILDTSQRTAWPGGRQSLLMMTGHGCRFDHATVGLVVSYVLSLEMNRFISFGSRPLNEESLGDSSLQGLHVTGSRFETMLPLNGARTGRGERWVSPDLKLVVYGRHEDPFVGAVEHRLTNIRTTEPPAHLFEMPADYIYVAHYGIGIVRPENPYIMRWENPYNDLSRRRLGLDLR